MTGEDTRFEPSRYRDIATSTWSDVLDELRINGLSAGLQWRSGPRMVGVARTVLEDVAQHGTFEWEAFDVGALVQVADRGEILVVDMAGADISTFGGLAARALVTRGVAGVVIDGSCRDVDEIRATGLSLASRSVTPRTGKRRIRLADLGVRVRIGGVLVSDGDLVVADETGTLFVPAAAIPDVLGHLEKRQANEQHFIAALGRGATFSEIAAQLKHS